MANVMGDEDGGVIRLISLVPINPSSISILDLILPPLLISLSILIYDLSCHHNHQSKRNDNLSRSSSHIFYLRTIHQRFKPSIHKFRYDLIYLGLDLDRLESNRLDIPYLFRFIKYRGKTKRGEKSKRESSRSSGFLISRLFNFDPITTISPGSYLFESIPRTHKNIITSEGGKSISKDDDDDNDRSIRKALVEELLVKDLVRNVEDEIGKTYLITMPAYLGYETINPLSIHFCYHPQKISDNHDHHPRLNLVVLEVHNTFGERHLYVLKVGSEEDLKPETGFKHQWTIPRSFHVSPFNDRSGFYQISLTDPFHHLSNSENDCDDRVSEKDKAHLKVRVGLLNSDREPKFFATLIGTGLPLNVPNLISALISYPFSLLLTSIRILYQSSILHLGKPRLEVYPRPEPAFDQEFSATKGSNPIQPGGQIGGVGWQKADWSSSLARTIVLDYLRDRIERRASRLFLIEEEKKKKGEKECQGSGAQTEKDDSISSFEDLNYEDDTSEDVGSNGSDDNKRSTISVILRPSDLTQPIIELSPSKRYESLPNETLTIDYGTPNFFVDLILFPSPKYSLLVSSESEGNWKVSSRELFLKIFEEDRLEGQSYKSLRRNSNSAVSSNLPFQKPGLGDDLGRNGSLLSRKILELMIRIRSFYLRWQISFISKEELEKKFGSRRSSLLDPPNFLPIDMDESFRCEMNPIEKNLLLRLEKKNARIEKGVDPEQTDDVEDDCEVEEEEAREKKGLNRELMRVLIIISFNVLNEIISFFLFEKVLRFRFFDGFEPWKRWKRMII